MCTGKCAMIEYLQWWMQIQWYIWNTWDMQVVNNGVEKYEIYGRLHHGLGIFTLSVLVLQNFSNEQSCNG